MKKILAFILCFAIFLTGCCSDGNKVNDNQNIDNASENIESIQKDEKTIEFDTLNDEDLLSYVEDLVYSETVKNLNSEEYVVEEVRAVYISKEYIDEVAFNSQTNMYFGYTIAELNEYFQGTRYVFTLGDNGETTVKEMQEIVDTDNLQILKNVAIGTGVILICVTVSVVSGGTGTPAAVTAIFTASAKTATTFAVSSAALGGISAGVVRGYQTGDINEALEAAALSGSEGFKWGAISGAVSGAGKEAFLLKAGTKNGLTMNEVAVIQKETNFPMEIIERFNSMKQYNICKKAGLKGRIVNNKAALVRKIDLDFVDDVTGKTNLQLMLDGKAPVDLNGNKYELHHIGQKKDSPLAILTREEHRQNGNDSIWHILTEGFENPAKQRDWTKIKRDFWKSYAEQAISGGV